MCRKCGSIVGAGQNSCAVCGASALAADAPQHDTALAQQRRVRPAYDREAMRFARAVFSRPYIFTIIFLVANIFIFLLTWYSSGLTTNALFEPSFTTLIAYGAKLNFLIKDQHQWWRFVTPVFLHIGIIHLLVNMYGLWILGPYVERFYGSAKFVVFWVVTGVAGVVASYLSVRPDVQLSPLGRFLFKTVDSPSAGASGALFGLIGVLFVFGIKFRHELPEGFKRAFGTGLLPIISINLFIGFLGRGFIDNAAHLGGLVAGAVLALIVGYKRPGERAGVAVFWHALQIAALVLVAVSFLMVARNFNLAIPIVNDNVAPQNNASTEMFAYLQTVDNAQGAFLKAVNEGNASSIDGALKALESAPRLDDESDALRNELKDLLARAKEFATRTAAATFPNTNRNVRRAQEEQRKLVLDFKSWSEKFRLWIETNGNKYGLQPVSTPTPAPDSSNETPHTSNNEK